MGQLMFSTPPECYSKITKVMFDAVVMPVLEQMAAYALSHNPQSTRLYVLTNSTKGGCGDLRDNKVDTDDYPKLAQDLVGRGLLDHGAIRSFYKIGSANPVLSGVKLFQERWQALGFIHRNPASDNYDFADRGVKGLHMELHPELIRDFGVNRYEDYDPHFFRWFMSHQDFDAIPDIFADFKGLLDNAEDPMTESQQKLLLRVQKGENLDSEEISQLRVGLYRFMTEPAVMVDDALSAQGANTLAQLEEASSDYKCGEYAVSGMQSTMNHVAFVTKDCKAFYKEMQGAGISVLPFQQSPDGKLMQFGSPAANSRVPWQEVIERCPITDDAGNYVDHDGNPSDKAYLKRTFEARNAGNLFAAGTPDSVRKQD